MKINKLAVVLLIFAAFFVNIYSVEEYSNEESYNEDQYLNEEYSMNEYSTQGQEVFAKGKVMEVVEEELNRDLGAGIKENYQKLVVEITGGEYKGKNLIVENSSTLTPGYNLIVEKGDQVLLTLAVFSGELENAYIVDMVRDKYVYYLVGIFVFLLLAIGKKKGLKSLISLIITFLIISKFMLPRMFEGQNPLVLGLITSIAVSFLTYLIIAGFSKKSISAFLGTTFGLLFAAVLAVAIGNLAHLTGMSSEESKMLLYVNEETFFDLKGILLAGIILGALGAVMDVCMSIASSIEEVASVSSDKSFFELFKSGMNVGNDIMGTMSNTLILAYTGASIPLMLLFMAYQQPFMKLINLEFLADEIIRALIGSIALIVAIPITAFFTALFLRERKETDN